MHVASAGFLRAEPPLSTIRLSSRDRKAWTTGGCNGRVSRPFSASLSGGFLGDHGDVGNWRCPLGIAALSVEGLIILLAAGRGAWQAQAVSEVRSEVVQRFVRTRSDRWHASEKGR
jgi:hypothetical protein